MLKVTQLLSMVISTLWAKKGGGSRGGIYIWVPSYYCGAPPRELHLDPNFAKTTFSFWQIGRILTNCRKGGYFHGQKLSYFEHVFLHQVIRQVALKRSKNQFFEILGIFKPLPKAQNVNQAISWNKPLETSLMISESQKNQ